MYKALQYAAIGINAVAMLAFMDISIANARAGNTAQSLIAALLMVGCAILVVQEAMKIRQKKEESE